MGGSQKLFEERQKRIKEKCPAVEEVQKVNELYRINIDARTKSHTQNMYSHIMYTHTHIYIYKQLILR